MPQAIIKPKVLSIIGLLRPHWKAMTMALVAVTGEATTDLLEPWPIKIVPDYVLQSRQLPSWMIMVGWIGEGKVAILSFALVAVAAIAVAEAASSYLEKYLTASVSRWVMYRGPAPAHRHRALSRRSFHANIIFVVKENQLAESRTHEELRQAAGSILSCTTPTMTNRHWQCAITGTYLCQQDNS